MKQEILRVGQGRMPVDWYFSRLHNGRKISRVLLVSDLPLDSLEITRYFRDMPYWLGVKIVPFAAVGIAPNTFVGFV